MKDVREELFALKDKAERYIECFILDEDRVVKDKAGELMTDISKVFGYFLSDIGELASLGVEIPVEIITGQLDRYMDAFKRYDTIALADVLKYEIMDSLDVYISIQEELYGN